MKKLLILIVFCSVVLCGCKASQNLNFEVVNLELQKPINYVFDSNNGIITISKRESVGQNVTIKINPPDNLKDLSEVMVWCNDIPFVNSNVFYSNGKQIYITLPKTKRITTKLSVKWAHSLPRKEYIVLFKDI